VIGSWLHRYAYPDYFKAHVERNGRELIEWTRGKTFDKGAKYSGETQSLEQFANVTQDTNGAARCLQLRGEYMFVAEGRGGFRVYDVASIGNKGLSERSMTAPFSPMGQDSRVESRNATCMAIATNQPINPLRNTEQMRQMNQEQPFHPIYELCGGDGRRRGLYLVDVNTFNDGEPRNNFLKRAKLKTGGTAWNEGGVLSRRAAHHACRALRLHHCSRRSGRNRPERPAGPQACRHRSANRRPRERAPVPLPVRDRCGGLKVIDVTNMAKPQLVPGAR
jgi:hypothetical protein